MTIDSVSAALPMQQIQASMQIQTQSAPAAPSDSEEANESAQMREQEASARGGVDTYA
jgi:hypothetical protein